MSYTFPIALFTHLDDFKCYSFEEFNEINKSSIFSSRTILIKNINQLEGQILLSAISVQVLIFIFDNKSKAILENELQAKVSIKNKKNFLEVANLKIDVLKLEKYLISIQNEDVSVDLKNLINELLIFLYKFIFVKISKEIHFFSSKNIKEVFDLKKIYDQHRVSKFEKENNSNFEKYLYFEKFGSLLDDYDENKRNLIINDIIIFTNKKKSRDLLNKILSSHIVYKAKVKLERKKEIKLTIFKMLTCRLFYPECQDLPISDHYLYEKYRNSIKI
jgi:hypothetical protein